MKSAMAQPQHGPQHVVRIKKGVEAVAVQHFVYSWPD